MINQISNNANKNVFAPLQHNGAYYAITKPFTNTQKTDEIKEKEKESNNLGYQIAKLAFFVGIGVLALAKGLPKNARLKTNKLFSHLEDKIHELNNKEQVSNIQNAYLLCLKGAKTLTKNSKAIFNTAPLKDVLVLRVMKKYPLLDKIGQRITNLFEKVSVRTSKNSYSKTLVRFDSMCANFADANKALPKEQAKIVEKKLTNIKNIYNDAFLETARNKRLTNVKNDLNGIDEKVWEKTYGNLKGIMSDGDMYKTYISEELAAKTKIKLHNEVDASRKAITNSILDNYNATNKLLKNVETFIDPTKKEPRILINNIRKTLKEYRATENRDGNAKKILLDGNIAKNLDELNKYITKSGKYDAKTTEDISKYIQELKDVLDNNHKGEIQEMLTTYKKYLPEKDYLKLKKQTYRTVKSLDKSIDLETDKLFDKIRDLKIGSAPTDIIGVLSSLGVVAWGLSKAENNNDRLSVALKFGIPVVGGVITTLFCTVGLIAAGPSLIIGLLSGAAINKLGIMTDNAWKKHKGIPIDKDEESLAKMSIDEIRAKSIEIEKKTRIIKTKSV